MMDWVGHEAIAVSISVSVLPLGLMTLAVPPSTTKVAGHRAAQVPQPIQEAWLILGCFIVTPSKRE